MNIQGIFFPFKIRRLKIETSHFWHEEKIKILEKTIIEFDDLNYWEKLEKYIDLSVLLKWLIV